MINILDSLLKKNKQEHNPCFFIYKTKRNEHIFFMSEKLNEYEKKHNKNVLKYTSIDTIKQGKQILFRFLKNNNSYEDFLYGMKLVYNDKLISLEEIIMYNFITPFEKICSSLLKRKNHSLHNKFYDLSFKWEKFLYSIRYI